MVVSWGGCKVCLGVCSEITALYFSQARHLPESCPRESTLAVSGPHCIMLLHINMERFYQNKTKCPHPNQPVTNPQSKFSKSVAVVCVWQELQLEESLASGRVVNICFLSLFKGQQYQPCLPDKIECSYSIIAR